LQKSIYVYDALNRLTLTLLHDGAKQFFTYDQGSNGRGRLSLIREFDPAGVRTHLLAYAYDPWGRIVSETRTVGTAAASVTAYRYDGGGRLDRIAYPSGRTVDYTYDLAVRIAQVATTAAGGSAQVVANAIAYQPFGGVSRFTYGNGQLFRRSVDRDGRIATFRLHR
jgi:YD repeat-containing protein